MLFLRDADASRAGAGLDRAGALELLAVEAESLDLVFHHTLDEERLAVAAPGRALAPVADLRLRDLGELLAVDRVDKDQAVIIEEGRTLRLVGAIHRSDGNVTA